MKILNTVLVITVSAVGLHSIVAQANPVINQILFYEETIHSDFVLYLASHHNLF